MEHDLCAEPLPEEVLASLAPSPLPYRRPFRSLGDERSVDIKELYGGDAHTVLDVYAMLARVEAAAATEGDNDCSSRNGVDPEELVASLQSLGRLNEYPKGSDAPKVLHDIRGGAATTLIHLLEQERVSTSVNARRALNMLARDQRKLMRSAVRNLDAQRRVEDVARRQHTAEHFLAAARAIELALPAPATLRIDCRFDGAVTACCGELGTLDRVFYNLVNNAARHAPRGCVRVWALPVPASVGYDIRVVVANDISQAQQRLLLEQFGGGMESLFVGGFSTTGSGVGMHVCAELVADAFGLGDAETAIAEKHVGARLAQQTFVSWFHWPAVRHADGEWNGPEKVDRALCSQTA